MTERRLMQRALVLARRGMGATRPNPPVGAVLARDGKIVGEGFHRVAGGPHAEIEALRNAGSQARGATLFVTLEPCRHFGKTPPCIPAVLEAGVQRVHIGCPDPHPESGGGVSLLREAGVEVSFGPCSREAAHLLAGFSSRVDRGRPRFHLKMASSIDGRIATASGDSKWISSPAARSWVHRRRREADAILIGAETAAKDNPALTTRHVAGRSPDRVIVDSTLRVAPSSRVFEANGVARIVATTEAAPHDRRAALEGKGVAVWTFPEDAEHRVSLPALASRLGGEGYNTVLVEGGGTLAGSMFRDRLVDEAWIVLSRNILLGGGGPGWADGVHVDKVARAPRIRRTEIRGLGGDWLITLVPESAQWWDPETLDFSHREDGAPSETAEAGHV